MSFTKESAVEKAKQDLAQRLGVSESEITDSVTDVEFPDMARRRRNGGADDYERLAHRFERERRKL